jgi:hypothetical protein
MRLPNPRGNHRFAQRLALDRYPVTLEQFFYGQSRAEIWITATDDVKRLCKQLRIDASVGGAPPATRSQSSGPLALIGPPQAFDLPNAEAEPHGSLPLSDLAGSKAL